MFEFSFKDNMGSRLMSAIIMVTLIGFVFIVYDVVYAMRLLVWFAYLSSVYEFLSLVCTGSDFPTTLVMSVASLSVALLSVLSYKMMIPTVSMLIAALGVIMLLDSSKILQFVSNRVFVLFYIWLPAMSMDLILQCNTKGLSRWWFVYSIVVAKSSDIGSLVVGRMLGKTYLPASVNSQKTWEGIAGGMAISCILGWFLSFYAVPGVNYLVVFLLTPVVSALAQLGDLVESSFKRSLGVGNSGIIPGLGGFLDMYDSLIFVCPYVYWLSML